MKLTISNKEQLDAWMAERRRLGHDMCSIKGDPPEGSTYSDGEVIKNLVNIAWKDCVTGQQILVKYCSVGGK